MRWLAHSRITGELLGSREIAPLVDLKAAMTAEIDTFAADGWEAECGPEWSFVFLRRGAERVQLTMQAIPPEADAYGPQRIGGGIEARA